MVDDQELWKRRFLAYMAARVAGLVIFLLGIAIAYTGLVRPGGAPQIGAVVAILGIIDSVFAPKLIKKSWERDEQ